jgi:hypothetical protein
MSSSGEERHRCRLDVTHKSNNAKIRRYTNNCEQKEAMLYLYGRVSCWNVLVIELREVPLKGWK